MFRQLLTGIRVVECGDLISAPYCGKLLADLGADVIKVEAPGCGDEARRYGPFPGDEPDGEKSGLFLYLNLNKRGVTVDLGSARGQERLRQLVRDADVLVNNFAPREAAALGLGFAAVRAINPAVVLCSLTAYGYTGPYKDLPAYHLNAAALGGACILGVEEREPLTYPLLQGHFQAGVHGALAVLFALLQRRHTGLGQHCDVAEADVWAGFHAGMSIHSYVFGNFEKVRWGSKMPGYYPFAILPCQDGYISEVAIRNTQFERFLKIIGDGEIPAWWAQDERFQDRRRLAWDRPLREEADQLQAPWLLAHTKEEIFRLCKEKQVPFCPVYDIREVVEHPHLQARGFLTAIEHAAAGALKYPGPSLRFEGMAYELQRPAPLLGEHNAEVFDAIRGGAEPEPAAAAAGRSGVGVPDEAAGPTRLPLAGYRVVDLGRYGAGPLTAMILADMGAEVIRVESAESVEPMRRSAENLARDPNRDPAYHNFNRNKLCIGLDYTKPAGAALLRQLVAASDVVVENLRPRLLARHGLDYAALRTGKPDLIMVSLPSAGGPGPMEEIVTFGPTLGALAGIDSLAGYAGGAAIGTQGWYCDWNSPAHAALGVLAALYRRERTGQGVHVEVAQWEATIACLGEAVMEYVMNGRTMGPRGNRHKLMAPHNTYPCQEADTWIAICAKTDEEWRTLCGVMGQAELAADPRFATGASRRQNEEALDAIIGAWTAGYAREAAAEVLQAAGVAAAPVLDAPGRFVNPQLQEREVYRALELPEGGIMIVGATPWKLSGMPAPAYRRAPDFAEHNGYIFGEVLGLSEAEVKRLTAAGVIYEKLREGL